jgi:hyperosmotically inducible protein
MTNDDLDRTVTGRINSDPALALYNLDVDANAEQKTVTVSGDVPSQGLRTKAVDAARAAMEGLVVTDEIDVKPEIAERVNYDEDMAREARERAAAAAESVGTSIEDAWLHTKIRGQLLAEGEFPGGSLNVDVTNAVVTLRGSVATRAERTKAEELAKATEGVKSVQNRITVKPGT